jgi:hypothetical protein
MVLSPDRSKLLVGSDTQGYYLTATATLGNHYTVQNTGIGVKPFWRQCAALWWSTVETNVIYSLTGENGLAGRGGLLAGVYSPATGNIKWGIRSAVPQGCGNHRTSTPAGLPSNGWQRSTGLLLFQNSLNLFAATYNQGVLRSSNTGGTGVAGTDDFPVAVQMAGAAPGTGNWFATSICADLTNVPAGTTFYASFYDVNGNPAGLYKCTNANAATPNLTAVSMTSGPTQGIEEVFQLGDYLYCAAGNQGIYRYGPLSGSPAWSAINGASVPTTATNWWCTVAGYIDGSGNHVLLVGDSNPTAGVLGKTLMSLSGAPGAGTGSITYTSLTGAVQIANVPSGPSSSYPWWIPVSGLHVFLGGVGYICPFVVVDGTTPASPNAYCAGSGGSYRSIGNLTSWTVADSGMPMFLGHPVAVSPTHADEIEFGDSDWGLFFDQAANGGEDATTLIQEAPQPSTQGFSVAFSEDGGTVYAGNGAKYTNASGKVWSRPRGSPNGWVSMALESHTSNKVAIGLAAFNDTGGNQIVCASVWGSGLWRWNGTAWSNRNASIGASGATGTAMHVVYSGAGLVWAYDRGNGIWRSTDYGLTWTNVWSKVSTDSLSGTTAYNRSLGGTGRLWVSTGGHLYKLGGADSGTVAGGSVTGSGASVFCPGSGVPGPVAYDHAGGIILATQDQGNGSGLWRSVDDGVTWQDITGGDGSFARANANPEYMTVSPVNGRVYVSGSNVVVQGLPGGGGGPPPGTSLPFTFVQTSANNAAASGVLALWFGETSGGPGPGGLGLPSQVGSLLVARLQNNDGTATITAPPGWVLVADHPAQATTGTARALTYAYLNNPGGLGSAVTAPTILPAGLRRNPPGSAAGAYAAALAVTGGPSGLGRPAAPVPAGGPLVILHGANSQPGSGTPAPVTGAVVFTSSNTAAPFKGRLVEYSTPAGSVQAVDAVGVAGAQAAATSLPVTASAANTFTGGLAVANFASGWSVNQASGSWSTPGGWTAEGSVNNTSVNFGLFDQTGIGAGPATVTTTEAAGTGGTENGWAAVLATFYATPGTPVQIQTTTLPGGSTGVPYNQTIAGINGVLPYSWAVTSGTLPTSVSFSSAGVLSGTPTVAGSYSFGVTVTDFAGQTATATFTIVIAAAVVITTTSPLPGGTTGVAYSVQFLRTGGTGPFTWAVVAGTLPPGLALGTAHGFLNGTPVLAGTYTFTVQVTDANGLTATLACSLTIVSGVLTIATQVLSFAALGQPYTAVLQAILGTPPYTWSLLTGSLPPGLALDTAGNLTGTANTRGSYTFTVKVTDAVAATATASFTITVYLLIPAPVIPGPWRIMFGPAQPATGINGIIGQAQTRNVTLRTEPDQADQVDIDIDGRSAPALGITELQTDFMVLFGDRPVFIGRVGATSDTLDSGAHRATFTALDYRSVLRRRAILPAGAGSPGSQLSWTSIEQATIVWNMLQDVQAKVAGDLGIARGIGQSTGTVRTYTATYGDMAGDDITTLAQMVNGFEWAVNPRNAQFTDLRLDLFSPVQGSDNGVVLRYGDGLVANISRVVDPSTYGNAGYFTGNSSKSLNAVQLASGLVLPPNGPGRWDVVVGTQDNTQSSLNDDAAGQFGQAQVVTPAYTIVLYPGAWGAAGGPDWLWKGDFVTVQIDDGRLEVNDRLRVVEMSFDIGNDNVETLTLTVGLIPFRVDKKIPVIFRRLRYLETR